MKTKNIQVSILIVNYKVEKELLKCIASIYGSKASTSFEIIVIDNSVNEDLQRSLRTKFPRVTYVKSGRNIGFGAACNIGAELAKGDYLFILNPDTVIKNNAIDILFDFMTNNPKAGMVAPLLLDPSENAYPFQGSDEYDLKSAIVTSSFINKIFPNNPISKRFFHKKWKKKDIEEVDVVPGTAFIINKSIFKKLGMFDEKIFLYFEEYDLAKRIKKLGYKNYIVPTARIVHVWEASAKKRSDIDKIFSKSRNYFFKKNYGSIFSAIVNLISSLGKYELSLGLIAILSIILWLYKIQEKMLFIGDQGWFYLSARDMLLNGQIPLVGIASSHPWLHQGPLWTYLLSPFLLLFNFNPVSGAYLTIILNAFAVVGIYLIGSTLFSRRIGLIASLLYGASPLVAFYARFPYHTSPIPLFVIILTYFLYKLVHGKVNYLPIVLFFLIILYNLEIAAVSLWGVLVSILVYVFAKDKRLYIYFLNKRNVILSFLAVIFPLLPIILYDIKNGFPQTLKFGAWIIYKGISLFSYGKGDSLNEISSMFNFLAVNFTRLTFASSNIISLIIFVCLICSIIYFIFEKRSRSYCLILLLFLIPFLAIILSKTPSDAYLPMLFPSLILLEALFFDWVLKIKKIKMLVYFLLSIIVFSNINFMIRNDFYFDKTLLSLVLDNRIVATKKILEIAENREYNLIGRGRGSEFASFTMNYQYLAWWMGHSPTKTNKNLKIYISESSKGIKVQQ